MELMISMILSGRGVESSITQDFRVSIQLVVKIYSYNM